MLDAMLIRPVTILRPTYVSDRGDDIADWSDPDTTDTRGWLAQRTAAEILDNRDASVTTWTLILAGGTDIRPTDRVEVDGQTYEVAGEPNPAWTPRGEHHLEVPLRKVDG